MRTAGVACALALGGVVVAAPRPAAAHPPPCFECEPRAAPAEPTRETEGGPWVVFVGVDGYRGVYLGARLAAGIRRGRLLFQGEADLGRAVLRTRHGRDLDQEIAGVVARAGGNVRWTYGRGHLGRALPIEYDFWLQAGLGVHVVQWWAGGRMVRPDAQVGFGLSQVIGRSRRISLDSAVVFIADRGPAGGAPTCAGPCDEPTAPVHGEFDVVDHFAVTVRW